MFIFKHPPIQKNVEVVHYCSYHMRLTIILWDRGINMCGSAYLRILQLSYCLASSIDDVHKDGIVFVWLIWLMFHCTFPFFVLFLLLVYIFIFLHEKYHCMCEEFIDISFKYL